MKKIIRLTCAVNKVRLADPAGCLEEIIRILDNAGDSDITVFPRLALCGAGCGSLFKNPYLADACSNALEQLREYTRGRDDYVIAGVALDDFGFPTSSVAVICNGDITLIPTPRNLPPSANQKCWGGSTVFTCGKLRFCVIDCDPSMLADYLAVSISKIPECDLVIILANNPMRAGLLDEIADDIRAASALSGCAVAFVNGGIGDTSSPWLYRGSVVVYSGGKQLAMHSGGLSSIVESVYLDANIIASSRKSAKANPVYEFESPKMSNAQSAPPIRRNPFLPEQNPERYLADLFDLQVHSLAVRMDNIGAKKLIIGVSGGIDSAAALLAAVGAVDALDIPREYIIAVSMPGPGTGSRTHGNGERLMKALGVSMREIPISEAVKLHLSDIGHSGTHDTAYENAQARERTQILMDIGNMENGFVVGTGDLSEEALGFCTFGGDHLAHYNVNVCITKTVLRRLLAFLLTKHPGETGKALASILDTPVSPELLPADEHGNPLQKTEDILGPYELHDFFLYYFVKYNMRPSQIYMHAMEVFEGLYAPGFIREKLELFLKRFCAAQFKRSCAPDCASITEVNLLSVNYYIPSDLNPAALLRELRDNSEKFG